MRVWLRRASALVPFFLILVATGSTSIAAQSPAERRGLAVLVQPEIRTRIESLLATPGVALATDYYHIDMRFGPGLRIDAVVVTAIDPPTRVRGLRVQVRDQENRARPDGTSYLDHDEVVSLSRALAPMEELASKWTGRDERRSMEVSFTSAGGFRLAIREFGRVQRAYLSTGLVDPVATSIEVSDLVTLKHALDQALSLLNDK
jgi:hypothetical protein